MGIIKIKIGHQLQADESIYLLSSGNVTCGNYSYKGRKKKEFKGIYQTILDLLDQNPDREIIDVSIFQYWNALNIYEEFIAKEWNRSIGARKLHLLSIETEVFLMIEIIKKEFKKAVDAKWRREIKKYDFDDPLRPSKGWHLFKKL